MILGPNEGMNLKQQIMDLKDKPLYALISCKNEVFMIDRKMEILIAKKL